MTAFVTYPSLRSAVVLVTGGASGIGEAVVRAFADQGSRTGFVEELAGRGAEARFEPCDLPERRGAVRRHQLPSTRRASRTTGCWAWPRWPARSKPGIPSAPRRRWRSTCLRCSKPC